AADSGGRLVVTWGHAGSESFPVLVVGRAAGAGRRRARLCVAASVAGGGARGAARIAEPRPVVRRSGGRAGRPGPVAVRPRAARLGFVTLAERRRRPVRDVDRRGAGARGVRPA